MSYGLSILTTEGSVDVTAMRAGRLYSSSVLTSSSGSLSVNGFDSTNGFIFVRANDNKIASAWSWDNNNQVLTFTATPNVSSPSTNMTAFFMVTT